MKIFRYLILPLILVAIAGAVAKAETKAETNTKTVLVLKKRNTVAFRDVVRYSSVKKVQQKAMALSDQLSKDEPIYLFLDTPGGSIVAGQDMITTLQSLPQKVHTVTNFAASMGYITAQSLNGRYILPTGTLMSHRAYMGEEGQVPGEFNTRSNYWIKRIEKIEKQMSKRVGLSLEEYQKLIKDEYWVDGQDAVDAKHADRVVYARCDESLQGTYEDNLPTIFGDIRLTWSECPLITVPIKVDFSDLDLRSYNESDRTKLAEVRKAVYNLLYNKKEFYKEYIVTNKYRQVFP